jgi:iron(III) transport system substrate-binding protein
MIDRLGRRRMAAVVTVFVMGLAACGGGGDDGGDEAERNTDSGPTGDAAWEEVVAAAQEEGSVTIYSSQGLDQLEDLGERFEDEYGISVEVVRDIDATLHQTIEAEMQTGNMVGDIIAQADTNWAQTHGAAGDFAEPTGPAFDEPDYNRDENVDENGVFISSAAVLTFGWNTNLYPDGLEDYDDLLDPELAGGQIGVMAPGSAAVVDFYDNYLAEKFGDDFVEDLAAQEPRIYESSLPMAQALTSGEISAASFVQVLEDEQEAGAPVDSGLSDTIWGARFSTGILAEAPHPNAAQVLANFMITPAGQEAIARKAASVLPDVEGSVATIDQVETQDLSTITPEVLTEFTATFEQLFQ